MPSSLDHPSTPWTEKYRPSALADVVHHERILRVLRHFLTRKMLPHFFFYGPPGTGKTSTILSCARELYGSATDMMVLHLNASDERGVDVVRKQIIQFVSTAPIFGHQHATGHAGDYAEKLVILDEADSMTESAQIALRDILVVYSARFCLIGNCQHSIIPALKSHMIKLVFAPVGKEAAIGMARMVLGAEGVPYTEGALEIIYDMSRGDLRKYVNVMQSVALRDGKLSEHCMDPMLQSEQEVADVVHYLRSNAFGASALHVDTLLLQHTHDFNSWLTALFRQVLVKETAGHVNGTAASASLLQFVIDMSAIEYNASFMVYTDIQLFSMVACLHQFLHNET
jgi:replication factor C subunit 3/5